MSCTFLILILIQALQIQACTRQQYRLGGFDILELEQCNSSYDVGKAVGASYATLIKRRLDESVTFQKLYAFTQTDEGNQLFQEMVQTNSQKYPTYWSEIQGIADGSKVQLDKIAVLNMRQELAAAIHQSSPANDPLLDPDACSDVLISIPSDDGDITLVAHNEDMTNDTLSNICFVKLVQPGLSWLAFVYAGELASTAFGVNSHGLAFTLNAVFPLNAKLPGVARNFLSRSLLDARPDEDDIVSAIGDRTEATGHSYNIMLLPSGQLLNIEEGPGAELSVQHVQNSWYFHANMYKRLDIPQRQDQSSIHREARAAQYEAPHSASDALYMLGDTQDAEFPIYRTNSSVITLCTALFNLDAMTLEVLQGNPRGNKVAFSVDLQTLEVSPGRLQRYAAGAAQQRQQQALRVGSSRRSLEKH